MESKTSLPLIFVVFFFCRLTGTFAQANFIEKSCANVTYPSLCQRSLSPYSEIIKTNRAVLTRTALIVTFKRTLSAQAYLNKLNRLDGLKTYERAAIGTCLWQMANSLFWVRESIKELKKYDHTKGQDFSLHMGNVNTWAISPLINADSCMEGFGGRAMDGKIKSSVLAQMTSLMHVASNAIDFVIRFAQKH